jgi:hypothetical protein
MEEEKMKLALAVQIYYGQRSGEGRQGGKEGEAQRKGQVRSSSTATLHYAGRSALLIAASSLEHRL